MKYKIDNKCLVVKTIMHYEKWVNQESTVLCDILTKLVHKLTLKKVRQSIYLLTVNFQLFSLRLTVVVDRTEINVQGNYSKYYEKNKTLDKRGDIYCIKNLS